MEEVLIVEEVQCVGEVSSDSKVSSSVILVQLCEEKKTDQSHEKLQNGKI